MPLAVDGMKICSNPNCSHNGQPQPVSNFFKNKRCKDGLHYYCKDCKKEVDQKNYIKFNTEIKNRKKEYREENIDTIREHDKDYRNSLAKYDTHYSKLEPYEECRRDPKNPELLQVRCKYSGCNKWFNPTNQRVADRVKSINGKTTSGAECNFYCSDECKLKCPIYGKIKFPEGLNPNKDLRPMQYELREMVIEENGCICEKCGKTKEEYPDLTFICHHVIPVKKDPIQSADKDNCVILCKECHEWIHKNIPGCTYFEIKNCLSKTN